MRRDTIDSASSHIARLLLLAAVAALAIWRLDDADTWWHLATGRYIATYRTIPAVDVFSYTATQRPWIDLQWIFQIGAYGPYQAVGISGLILSTAACAVATFVLLGVAARSSGTLSATFALTLALLAAHERFMIRPEICSFVLFASYLALFETRASSNQWLWLVVPLQALWVNVHGLFVVGLVLVWCYTAGRTVGLLVRKPRTDPALRRWWLVATGATAACLLNPYGVEGIKLPLTLLTRLTSSKDVFASIGEFASPFQGTMTPSVYAYVILIAVSAAALLLHGRAWRIDRMLAWSAFLVLSATARRNMGFFALISVPIVADGVAELQRRLTAFRRFEPYAPAARSVAAVTLSLALAVLIFWVVTNRFYWASGSLREFGLGISSIDFPMQATDFMDQAQVSGPLFNDLAIGGYLIWREFPTYKVFIDGRLEVYEDSFFARYAESLAEPTTFDAIAKQYDINSVLLFHAWPNRGALIRHLAGSEEWALIYFDETAVLFVRNRSENSAAAQAGALAIRQQLSGEVRPVADNAIPPSTSLVWPVHAPYAHLQKGNLLLLLQQWAVAAREFEAALRLRPDFLPARVALGYARWDAGEHDAARAEWRRVLATDPSFAPALEALQLAASREP